MSTYLSGIQVAAGAEHVHFRVVIGYHLCKDIWSTQSVNNFHAKVNTVMLRMSCSKFKY